LLRLPAVRVAHRGVGLPAVLRRTVAGGTGRPLRGAGGPLAGGPAGARLLGRLPGGAPRGGVLAGPAGPDARPAPLPPRRSAVGLGAACPLMWPTVSFGEFVKRHLVDTRPLAVPAYRRLWVGQAVSHVGLAATVVAVSQQVYELTGSSFWVGMLGLANLIPLVVFGLWGGAVADAVDRRKLLVTGSLVAWLGTVLILLQAIVGVPSVYVLLATVSLSAAGFAVSSSTRGAIIPRLLPAELVPPAHALNSLVYSLGAVGGPMVGGVLLTQGGFAAAYAADAV